MGRWFCSFEELARSAGLAEKMTSTMIDAGCAPGPIYGLHKDEGWWSALAGYTGDASSEPPTGGQLWYSPAAAWWLRRAALMHRDGYNLAQAAAQNESIFRNEFCRLLPAEKDGALAYPDCFTEEGEIVASQCSAKASSEWRAWVSGAYGVCLRDFSAGTCIRKETLAAKIKQGLARDEIVSNDENWKMNLLDKLQELSSLITPFAPWERPTGTPGKTIDVALHSMELGGEFPYSP
ncbi:MAG: hypothetical protein DHS20C05_04160 [Hyphococcus sp.]|nr:MAG: hypothetical protein DHS20C05_04160 [Marinicaulis sp.]